MPGAEGGEGDESFLFIMVLLEKGVIKRANASKGGVDVQIEREDKKRREDSCGQVLQKRRGRDDHQRKKKKPFLTCRKKEGEEGKAPSFSRRRGGGAGRFAGRKGCWLHGGGGGHEGGESLLGERGIPPSTGRILGRKRGE